MYVDKIQTVRVLVYVCTVCMAGYPSENARISEVKCNRIIENKRNKTKNKQNTPKKPNIEDPDQTAPKGVLSEYSKEQSQ